MQMLNLKLANFTGYVATSVPSGYDYDGLPTGLKKNLSKLFSLGEII